MAYQKSTERDAGPDTSRSSKERWNAGMRGTGSRLLLAVALAVQVFALAKPRIAASAQADEPPFQFRENDAVKFSGLKPDGQPGQVTAFPSPKDLEDFASRATEAQAAGRPVSMEGATMVDHDTLGTVVSIARVLVGRE